MFQIGCCSRARAREEFRRPWAASMFRLASSTGNGLTPPWKERERKSKRKTSRRRPADCVAARCAPREFVVCVFRYESSRSRRARTCSTAGPGCIVIYERSFVEFADDILPRGATRLLTGCCCCSCSQLQCRISHLRRFRHLLHTRSSSIRQARASGIYSALITSRAVSGNQRADCRGPAQSGN